MGGGGGEFTAGQGPLPCDKLEEDPGTVTPNVLVEQKPRVADRQLAPHCR